MGSRAWFSGGKNGSFYGWYTVGRGYINRHTISTVAASGTGVRRLVFPHTDAVSLWRRVTRRENIPPN
jgi:hypothetical protein